MNYSLLGAHLEFKKHVMSGLKDYGINPGQPKIMYYLSSHKGCSQKDIANSCYVESATLTSVLSNMEKQNLIERKRVKNDRRSYSIYPKKEAKELYDAVEKQFEDTLSVALEGFSEKEVEDFNSYLVRMESNLKKSRAKQEG